MFVIPDLVIYPGIYFSVADYAAIKTWVCEGGVYVAIGSNCIASFTYGGPLLLQHFDIFGEDIRFGSPSPGCQSEPPGDPSDGRLNTPYKVVNGPLEDTSSIAHSSITVIDDTKIVNPNRKLFGSQSYSWV